MAGPKLSLETQRRVEMMYYPEQVEEVTRLLVEECGYNIPGTRAKDDEHSMERLRFAALKVSSGHIGRLKEAVDLAKVDYRDVLLWAGFANDVAKHKAWLPEAMGPQKLGWVSWLLRRIGGRG
jgi:hypothetical protein